MVAERKRFIKVRVNALGHRIIGILCIPPPYDRVSDFINGPDEFLLVKKEHTDIAIVKDAISYLEAIDEGRDDGSRPSKGSFHPVTVSLRDGAGTIEGEIFIPNYSNLIGTLNKARRFVNLRNVHFVNSPERYDFLAIGKQEIIDIEAVTRLK